MLFGFQKFFVDFFIVGMLFGWIIGGFLKEFIYCDVYYGEVDEISFKLVDGFGFWWGGWGIDEGIEVFGLMGYVGLIGVKVLCGFYIVGEIEVQGDGGGDVVVFYV